VGKVSPIVYGGRLSRLDHAPFVPYIKLPNFSQETLQSFFSPCPHLVKALFGAGIRTDGTDSPCKVTSSMITLFLCNQDFGGYPGCRISQTLPGSYCSHRSIYPDSAIYTSVSAHSPIKLLTTARSSHPPAPQPHQTNGL